MTWVDPQLRAPRKLDGAKWARAHLWRCCALCDVTPGSLQYLADRLNRFTARRWLRAQGFDPDLPLGICDHIVPFFEGGTDAEENLQLLCMPCHKRKSAEEAARRPRLVKKRLGRSL